jgi:hypothetical protein
MPWTDEQRRKYHREYQRARRKDPDQGEEIRRRARDYQRANREVMSQRSADFAANRRQETLRIIHEFKADSHCCLDCHYYYTADVYEIIRTDTKRLHVVTASALNQKGVSTARVLQLLTKCDTICQCCLELRKLGIDNPYKHSVV